MKSLKGSQAIDALEKKQLKARRLKFEQNIVFADDTLKEKFNMFLKNIGSEMEKRGISKPKQVFISYAWPDPKDPAQKHLSWVQPFLKLVRHHLILAGLDEESVLMDATSNPIGKSIKQFAGRIKKSDFVLIIGTESLHIKDKKGTSTACDELNKIKKMRERKNGGELTHPFEVLPILISGDYEKAFPGEYPGRISIECWWESEDRNYFSYLRSLIARLYGIKEEILEPIWGEFLQNIFEKEVKLMTNRPSLIEVKEYIQALEVTQNEEQEITDEEYRKRLPSVITYERASRGQTVCLPIPPPLNSHQQIVNELNRQPDNCTLASSAKTQQLDSFLPELRTPPIYSDAIKQPIFEQETSHLKDLFIEETKLAKKSSEENLSLDERAHQTYIEEDNQERLTHGIQGSKQNLNKKSEKHFLQEPVDNHWYSDDEIIALLRHYIGNHPEVAYLDPMLGTNWGDEHNTLCDNLKDYHLERTRSQERGESIKNKVIIPINLGHGHWVLVYAIYPENSNQLSQIYYFDSKGDKPPRNLETILLSEGVFPECKIIEIGKRVQEDDYNCGPWIIEASRTIAHNGAIPEQWYDISSARIAHINILNETTYSHKSTHRSFSPASQTKIVQNPKVGSISSSLPWLKINKVAESGRVTAVYEQNATTAPSVEIDKVKGAVNILPKDLVILDPLLPPKQEKKHVIEFPSPIRLTQSIGRTKKRRFQPQEDLNQFIPREDILERINCYFTSKLAHPNQHFNEAQKSQYMCLCGKPKTGKSSIAKYYMGIKNQQYNFRAWFNAHDKKSLYEQYFALAKKAHIIENINEQDKDRIREKVKDWLSVTHTACTFQISDRVPHDDEVKLGTVIFYQENGHWWYRLKTLENNIITEVADDLQQLECQYLENGLKELQSLLTRSRRKNFNAIAPLVKDSYREKKLITIQENIFNQTRIYEFYNRRCLLIFDGTTDHRTIEKFLPRNGADIIVTSRATSWSQPYKTIIVSELTPTFDEAVAYIKKIRKEDGLEDIEKLVKVLKCSFPLLVEATEIINRQRISIKQYLEAYHSRNRNNEENLSIVKSSVISPRIVGDLPLHSTPSSENLDQQESNPRVLNEQHERYHSRHRSADLFCHPPTPAQQECNQPEILVTDYAQQPWICKIL